ncbi:MAG: PDC sensor domain-containing protein [Deltaproteobacteria bacterium]|nr:PDC sensor domain-containing protein [Deltaproteobacteria bacterium]MBW2371990.1 PDC sensor domain-containing protein [Deltaproteobacteria bacterium]
MRCSQLARCVAVATLLATLSPAGAARAQQAQEATDLLLALIRLRSPGIENVGTKSQIIEAVAAQNGFKLSDAEIQKRDGEWQASIEVTPFKKQLQTNEAGRILRGFVERGNKTYTEGLLMDKRGALVAAYPAPSDYYQGDEDKFRSPFQSGELYIGPIHFDHSTQAYVSDVCTPIFEEGSSAIGVLCMAVRLSKGPGIAPDKRHE